MSIRTLVVSFAALALAAGLSTPPACATPAGAWQPLSGPWQNGASVALDDTHHRLFTFGGDHSDMVRVLTLDGFPYPWALFGAASTPPAIRARGSLSYDLTHDRLIVFGGVTPDGVALNDVWSLNLSGAPTWTQLTTAGTPPDPRSDFGACYDAASGKLFVFGGFDADGNVEPNDLFALDLDAATPTWSQPLQTGAVPSARAGAPLALDAAGNRIFLFGGYEGFNDTNDEYELDLATFTWTSQPMSGVIPDPRSNHLCVWDRASQQLVVWGGTASDDSIRAMPVSTREWSSLSWFIGPPARVGFEVGVYDWQWNRIVVLAGQRGAEAFTFYKSLPDNFWYLTGPGNYPIAGSMVMDRANGRAVAYGGTNWNGQYVMNEFWQYAFTNPQGWNGVNTGGVPAPARTAHLAVWDEKHDRMLVIAGRDETVQMTNSVYALSDSADFMNWKGLAPTGTPPSARIHPAGIYDPVGDRVLLYGGGDVNNLRGGLHQLALTPSPAWTTLAPAGGPTGRMAANAIYDEPRHRMILFGGADSVSGNYMNDVWALNLPAATWTHLLPTGAPPMGRWKSTAVYDSRRQRMVIFGGRTVNGDSADVWELTLAPATPAWTRLASSGDTPLFRSEASAVYDSLGDRMVIYGGASLIAPGFAVGEQDLWSLQFSGGSVAAVGPERARGVRLGQPWPNPARAGSHVSFTLAEPANVQAAVYDVAGRQVRAIASGPRAAGTHTLAWDGRNDAGARVASGLYFYRVQLGAVVESRKVVLTE